MILPNRNRKIKSYRWFFEQKILMIASLKSTTGPVISLIFS